MTAEFTMDTVFSDEISLFDGSKITGIILRNDNNSLTVETIGRTRTIKKAEVKSIG